jgi:hypothetical protein
MWCLARCDISEFGRLGEIRRVCTEGAQRSSNNTVKEKASSLYADCVTVLAFGRIAIQDTSNSKGGRAKSHWKFASVSNISFVLAYRLSVKLLWWQGKLCDQPAREDAQDDWGL